MRTVFHEMSVQFAEEILNALDELMDASDETCSMVQILSGLDKSTLANVVVALKVRAAHEARERLWNAVKQLPMIWQPPHFVPPHRQGVKRL